MVSWLSVKALAGTSTKRPTRACKDTLKSSHAAAWGTRAFMASQFAREALSTGFSASAMRVSASSDGIEESAWE